MRAYKMMTKRKDGSYGPLFINRKQRVALRTWYVAEDHRTIGYAHRPGWHCCPKPHAPHLMGRDNRVWVEVEIKDYNEEQRPKSQGGMWYLAKEMQIIKELE